MRRTVDREATAEDANDAVGDLDVEQDLSIVGAGSGVTLVTGGPNWEDRLFEARSSPALRLEASGLSLSGGNPSPAVGASEGGAIYFEALSGQLELRDVGGGQPGLVRRHRHDLVLSRHDRGGRIGDRSGQGHADN